MTVHHEGLNEGTNLGVGTCVRERPLAILVEFQRLGEERWIPQSVVHPDSEVYKKGQKGKVIVYTWWAEKNPDKGTPARPRDRLPLPMRPASKEWTKAQAERRERAKRG